MPRPHQNFEKESIAACRADLEKNKSLVKIMVDFSHGNSKKQHKNQLVCCQDISEQVSGGDKSIFGVMIESNVNEVSCLFV
jgi:3-deoxy-7-phosphoheptulonate synthase